MGDSNDRKRPDTWTRKAKEEGYAARSAYKLEQIDQQEKIVPRQGRVLDLGCSPGSWSQYLRRKSGRDLTLVGVDLDKVQGYPGAFIQASALEIQPETLLEALGGRADLVLSDMAPNTSGHRFTDHVRQIELAQAALSLAVAVLRPGGDFVVKVFDGGDAPAYLDEVRARFTKVKRVKPKTTRAESVEFFVVGRGFKGEAG